MTHDPLTHAEVETLLGALALEALDCEERDLVAGHVLMCPVCHAELAELTAATGRLAALDDEDLLPPAHLGDAAVRTMLREQAANRRRSRLLAGVAGLVVIAAGMSAAVVLSEHREQARQAPVVAIDVSTDRGVTATAGYVAHTWGLEIRLDASGLAPRRTYDVVVIDNRGRASTAGAFVGTGAATLRCNLNAGVLAPDVASFAVRDARGRAVIRGDL